MTVRVIASESCSATHLLSVSRKRSRRSIELLHEGPQRPLATGGGPQFTQTRKKLSIQVQARRRLLHCAFGSIPQARMLQALRVQKNKGIEFMFNNIDLFSIFLGSHNEESVSKALILAEKMSISNNHPNLYFGQLYGMSDNLTFTLAKYGYNSVKYLPYGPVKEVIPFLIRRAEENTSVSGQTNRELDLIKSEVKRRKTIT